MRLVLFSFVTLATLGVGCTSEDRADDDVVNCTNETRADEFVVGIEKPGRSGLLNFRILSANPAPPARNDNTWTIQVNSMSSGVIGAPVTGASLIVSPFMPDHQHGAGKDVTIEPMPDAGQYQLAPINMWMPGLWETTIDASSPSGADKVVFKFCIPS